MASDDENFYPDDDRDLFDDDEDLDEEDKEVNEEEEKPVPHPHEKFDDEERDHHLPEEGDL